MTYENYDQNDNKIRNNFNRAQKNKNKIDNLHSKLILDTPITNIKRVIKVETEWKTGNTSAIVTLTKFPDRLVSFIKVIPMVKTILSSDITDYVTNYTITKGESDSNERSTYIIVATVSVTTEAIQQLYTKIVILIINDTFYGTIKTNKT